MSKKLYSKSNLIKTGHAKDIFCDGCLVLEGGALRGLFTSGVLDALMENNLNFKCVIGTSAGVLNGMNYVSGNIGRSARMNINYRHDSHYIGLPALIENKGVFGFEFLFEDYRQIEEFNESRFFLNNQRLIATCTSCLDGQTKYFEKGIVSDFYAAAKASASMPFLSKMVTVEGIPCLDGGCSCKIPYKWAIDNGFERIVIIRTRSKAYRKTVSDNDLIDKIVYHNYPEFEKAVSSMNKNYNIQCDEIEELTKSSRVYTLYPEKPIHISRLEGDIEKLGDLYFQGYNQGLKEIESIKEYLKK